MKRQQPQQEISNRLLQLTMRIVLIMAVPILLVAGSVRLLMIPGVLQLEYTRPGFPQDFYGFSTEDRLQYGPLGVQYLLNGDDISFLADQTLPGPLCFPMRPTNTECPMFNVLELEHMEDVKVVMQGTFLIAFGFALLTIGIGISLWNTPQRRLLYTGLMQGSLLTLSAIVAIITVAIAAWDLFFDTFHAIFFEEGTWRFYYSDTLIRLYPEQFWFDASLSTGILTTLGALVILGICWRASRLPAEN